MLLIVGVQGLFFKICTFDILKSDFPINVYKERVDKDILNSRHNYSSIMLSELFLALFSTAKYWHEP